MQFTTVSTVFLMFLNKYATVFLMFLNRYATNPSFHTQLETYPVSGLESWARFRVVSHFLCNSVVQPQPMQPCIPVSTKGERIASPQTLVSLSILIKIGRRF